MDDKLSALRRAEDGDQPSRSKVELKKRFRNRVIRMIPWAAAGCLLWILFLIFKDSLLPARGVHLETVVTVARASESLSGSGHALMYAEDAPYDGSTLFQASGWFEADPFPYRVTALTDGVVETVHVLEGQEVKSGEPIVTLIRIDAELLLNRAQSAREMRQSDVASSEMEHALAIARKESMEEQILLATARKRELEDLAKRSVELGEEVISVQEITQSELRVQTQERAIAVLESQLVERRIEVDRASHRLQTKEAQLAEAEIKLREAEIAFERTIIRSPVDGFVQTLMAEPGQKKVRMSDNPESITVAKLFKPDQLQARIDVPIAEVGQVEIGQAVIISSELFPGQEIQGYVQRIVGEADLQRNTLQVKVKLLSPPAKTRPEVLCRAKFLDRKVSGYAKTSTLDLAGNTQGKQNVLAVMVSLDALQRRTPHSATVWVVDESGHRIHEETLKLSNVVYDGYVEVESGLKPGDRVVLHPSESLRNRMRIKELQH